MDTHTHIVQAGKRSLGILCKKYFALLKTENKLNYHRVNEHCQMIKS